MNTVLQTTLPTPGAIAVEAEGVMRGHEFIRFRPAPTDGYSRKDIAGLFCISHGSVKRIETKCPDLASGR